PDGSTLIRADDHPAQVLDPQIARTETEMLTHVLSDGTAQGSLGSFPAPAAGKTGTNENHEDAWFAGYTPALATTVWVGYTRGEIPMENVHGIAVAGGTFPATIWHLFMQRALANTPALTWPSPRDPVVWRPFTQGQYGSSLRPTTTYYYSPTTSSTTTSTPTTTAQVPPPPPPPPPATTGRTITTGPTPPPPPPPSPPPPPRR
ncbi:MAG TPA: penicillin-binding transpeptidase domain-containing protein, partial [Gaiellaceae bacterium]|nr:penicillin-binding transpeptidase domain-containing protein [Gaiellaceae bacterium]